MKISIHTDLLQTIPGFKVGVVRYDDITITQSPQMVKGRLAFFQEKIKTDLMEEGVTQYPGVVEWRQLFKALGMDPSRYRPSHEALFRRIGKGQNIPPIHSAADLNNFFSLQYEMPCGIYDLTQLSSPVELRLGHATDEYEALNGRTTKMEGKLLSGDEKGAFGSPIVDSARSITTEDTRAALQLLYLPASLSIEHAKELVQAASQMFIQVHGGTNRHEVLHNVQAEVELA
ncbi:B3/4 domain-containing protein [Salsuginibacillus kocurii]|uniref:B3/B4 domain-containing protein n=1 Tax=Salsuginibacillus kocurii TaxID=427078 RepID=UPI000367C2C3|nr:phenylalanine--tRNA ligase beta subunit-related protein [Salsuginibacillus kocurii]